MGDKTKIPWADATWNPVSGCSKVSSGCLNCYAERMSHRCKWTTLPWTAGNSDANVRLHPERLDQPLRWRRPRRVFVVSMGDLFHQQVPDEFIDDVFARMFEAQHHTYLVLTKRPQRMLDYVHSYGPRCFIEDAPYIWLGVTVEDQRAAEERIPLLLATPAAVRWVSVEPMLSEIDLSGGLRVSWQCGKCKRYFAGPWHKACPQCGIEDYWSGSHRFNPPSGQVGSGLSLVVCGGESGPHARPMDLAWARSLRDQCRAAGVPFFFKQRSQADGSGYKDFDSFPIDLQIREYPNTQGGSQ